MPLPETVTKIQLNERNIFWLLMALSIMRSTWLFHWINFNMTNKNTIKINSRTCWMPLTGTQPNVATVSCSLYFSALIDTRLTNNMIFFELYSMQFSFPHSMHDNR